jgi:hypothetical protein
MLKVRDGLYSNDEATNVLKGVLNPKLVENGLIILDNNVIIYVHPRSLEIKYEGINKKDKEIEIERIQNTRKRLETSLNVSLKEIENGN